MSEKNKSLREKINEKSENFQSRENVSGVKELYSEKVGADSLNRTNSGNNFLNNIGNSRNMSGLTSGLVSGQKTSGNGGIINSNFKDRVLYPVQEVVIKINNEICDVKDLSFILDKKVGEHDFLDMEFTILTEETDKYHSYVFSLENILEMELNRITEFGEEDGKNIFYGTIENIDIELSASERSKCFIRTYSESIKMDKMKKYRSFLDPELTYEDIVQKVMEEYDINYSMGTELSEPIKHVYVQNGETDWVFLRRVLADLNIPVFSHLSEVLFGEINSETYNADLDRSLYGRGREKENILFKVKGTDPYNVGEKVNIKFQEGEDSMAGVKLVSKSYLTIEENYIKCDYELVDLKGGHKYAKYPNNLFIGKAIEGTVIEVLNDEGIAKLTLDLSIGLEKFALEDDEQAYADEYAGKFQIPYTTPYSQSNTGLFCTPEAGDIVKLFFPGNNEWDSYVQGAVNNTGNGRFSDYENRNFHVNESDFNLTISKDSYSVSAASSISQSANSISETAKTILNNSENHTETVRNDKILIAKNISQTAAKNTTIKSNSNTLITASGVSTVSGGQKVNING